MLGYDLVSPEDIWARQGFFLCIFKDQKPKGWFTLSSTAKIVGYCEVKTNSKGWSSKCDHYS